MSIQSGDAAGAAPDRPRWALVAGLVAIVFGILTVLSGGSALFGGEAARAAVGNAVAFVLWFNFVAGFFYVLAGVGLVVWRRWAAYLSAAIAIATLAAFAGFGWHVASGGAYEARTVGAMILRCGIWLAIAIPACRVFAYSSPKHA